MLRSVRAVLSAEEYSTKRRGKNGNSLAMTMIKQHVKMSVATVMVEIIAIPLEREREREARVLLELYSFLILIIPEKVGRSDYEMVVSIKKVHYSIEKKNQRKTNFNSSFLIIRKVLHKVVSGAVIKPRRGGGESQYVLTLEL